MNGAGMKSDAHIFSKWILLSLIMFQVPFLKYVMLRVIQKNQTEFPKMFHKYSGFVQGKYQPTIKLL